MLKSSSLCLYSSNLGTFWLKIEQFWPFEEISILFLKGDHLRIISAKFGWNWLSSFRGEDFFYKIGKSSKFIKNPVIHGSSLCLYSSNFGTFWLKIEQFWPFEEISIFSNGGHLGYRTALTDTNLKGDHLRIISAKFGWNWLSSFRGEYFFLISSPLFLNFIIGQNR